MHGLASFWARCYCPLDGYSDILTSSCYDQIRNHALQCANSPCCSERKAHAVQLSPNPRAVETCISHHKYLLCLKPAKTDKRRGTCCIRTQSAWPRMLHAVCGKYEYEPQTVVASLRGLSPARVTLTFVLQRVLTGSVLMF
eukprot:6183586-Pleurochrysis_carterae.AAC.3